MGLLDDAMQTDAAAIHNADQFGESVMYTPIAGAGSTYTAVVDRRPQEPVDGQSTGIAPNVVVSLARDPAGTNGPASVSLGDTITLKTRIGDLTTTEISVVEILENDAGAWLLQCR
jgi:hypothetical protein